MWQILGSLPGRSCHHSPDLPSLSLGLSNPDFQLALDTFVEKPTHFSPVLAIRSWINPISEPDVKFIEPAEPTNENEDKEAPIEQPTPDTVTPKDTP
ncbi:hypothetical protein [Dictyobacter kobayashii]|uniref:Uncharacterized protein n=1 Tax=Dictyobacter kobayashii TaxID=2014872 RepID=A0A402ACZ3_9CHLR|nr:hypothetical protein [Dictyobacter kobayashii]GCE16977.1 hypothetical protein KDK_07770 [Dictyobacter kobayashii]